MVYSFLSGRVNYENRKPDAYTACMNLGDSCTSPLAVVELPPSSEDGDAVGPLSDFFLDLATEERRKADLIFEWLFNHVDDGLASSSSSESKAGVEGNLSKHRGRGNAHC